MAHGVYTRYVALGGQINRRTVGRNDSDGIAGFADRPACMLDALRPGLHYANLTIRGATVVTTTFPISLASSRSAEF